MPLFLRKAENNIDRAEFLVKEGHFLASPHPAYYSAFLLMKHLLAVKNVMSYEEQDAQAIGQGSHTTLSNYALICLASLDIKNRNDYITWFQQLKKMRRESDYSTIPIDERNIRNNLKIAHLFFQTAKANI